MNDNLIRCMDLEQFLSVIHGLVKRGVTFTADADKLIVYLTGGY